MSTYRDKINKESIAACHKIHGEENPCFPGQAESHYQEEAKREQIRSMFANGMTIQEILPYFCDPTLPRSVTSETFWQQIPRESELSMGEKIQLSRVQKTIKFIEDTLNLPEKKIKRKQKVND